MNNNNNEINKYMTYINTIVNVYLYNFLDQPVYPSTTSPDGEEKDTSGISIISPGAGQLNLAFSITAKIYYVP